jgi:predicted Zn finger-like uncharacterized protein
MSLATRCVTCGTIFRVAQEQLKVSEGWVRCGRCKEVFNALEGLFDLSREAPPDWSPGLSAGAPRKITPPEDVTQAAVHAIAASASEVPPTVAPRLERFEHPFLGGAPSGAQSTPADRVSERDRLEFPDAQFDPDLLRDDPEVNSGYQLTVLEEIPAGLKSGADPAPEFVRQAQREQQWRSPRRRAALGVLTVLLVAALSLQVAHHFRDVIAARWPAGRAALSAWCGVAKCTLQPPKRIDDLTVEATALEQAGSPDTFKLSVALRNRGTVLLALPSVELSLTDPAGQLVARRVLAPADFHAASTVIAPGADTQLQLVLSDADAKVAGYTVEIFYP